MEHASCHPAGVFLRWLLDLWKICGPQGYGMQHMIFKHCNSPSVLSEIPLNNAEHDYSVHLCHTVL